MVKTKQKQLVESVWDYTDITFVKLLEQFLNYTIRKTDQQFSNFEMDSRIIISRQKCIIIMESLCGNNTVVRIHL